MVTLYANAYCSESGIDRSLNCSTIKAWINFYAPKGVCKLATPTHFEPVSCKTMP